ncbi:MAG: response regulator [Myxococcota bacterium]
MKKVMIVDDSPLARQLVRAAVSSMIGVGGAEFLEAEDGSVALRQLTVKKVDLIVCDLNMPVLDGHALLARVRGLSLHKTTPFIVLSSLVNDAKVVQLKAAGANAVLKKPFSTQQLKDSLRAVGL